VISPLEDETWTDPAGNETAVGSGKVSHLWGLRSGGQRLKFWDPWLPPTVRATRSAIVIPERGWRFRFVGRG
jgi:hypothetical protein